jgi:hypothetical protein
LISKFSKEKGVVLPYDEDRAVAEDFGAGDDSDEETGIIDDGESFVKGETTNMGGGDVRNVSVTPDSSALSLLISSSS